MKWISCWHHVINILQSILRPIHPILTLLLFLSGVLLMYFSIINVNMYSPYRTVKIWTLVTFCSKNESLQDLQEMAFVCPSFLTKAGLKVSVPSRISGVRPAGTGPRLWPPSPAVSSRRRSCWGRWGVPPPRPPVPYTPPCSAGPHSAH